MPNETPEMPKRHDVVSLQFRANASDEPYKMVVTGFDGEDVEWAIDQIALRAKKVYRDMVEQGKTGEEYRDFVYDRAVKANAEARNG